MWTKHLSSILILLITIQIKTDFSEVKYPVIIGATALGCGLIKLSNRFKKDSPKSSADETVHNKVRKNLDKSLEDALMYEPDEATSSLMKELESQLRTLEARKLDYDRDINTVKLYTKKISYLFNENELDILQAVLQQSNAYIVLGISTGILLGAIQGGRKLYRSIYSLNAVKESLHNLNAKNKELNSLINRKKNAEADATIKQKIISAQKRIKALSTELKNIQSILSTSPSIFSIHSLVSILTVIAMYKIGVFKNYTDIYSKFMPTINTEEQNSPLTLEVAEKMIEYATKERDQIQEKYQNKSEYYQILSQRYNNPEKDMVLLQAHQNKKMIDEQLNENKALQLGEKYVHFIEILRRIFVA